MGKAGFARTVMISGKEYHLPDGEYILKGHYLVTQVAEKARVEAAKVKPDPAVYVTPCAGERFAINLEPLKAGAPPSSPSVLKALRAQSVKK